MELVENGKREFLLDLPERIPWTRYFSIVPQAGGFLLIAVFLNYIGFRRRSHEPFDLSLELAVAGIILVFIMLANMYRYRIYLYKVIFLPDGDVVFHYYRYFSRHQKSIKLSDLKSKLIPYSKKKKSIQYLELYQGTRLFLRVEEGGKLNDEVLINLADALIRRQNATDPVL